jgi:hypothetical protein
MKKLILLFLSIHSFSATYAQLGVNADNTAPHSSAMLDVKSTTKAFYPPRMTTTQKEAIVSPQVGAVVFDITLNQLSFFNGTAWGVASGSSFTLPFSGTSTAANNLLYIENTSPISNFSTIYGKTNSSATTSGIYGLAASTASTNNTAGVRGQNNSANSFGYGVEGIHTGAGIGGHFSSNTGYALITNNGNVGIGTPTPTLGGLVVNRKVGAVNALFGSNATGVAIETDYPGIGLNTYYNNGRKIINTGFGGLLGLNPITGTISVYNTATSITGQGTVAPLYERLTLLANGNVGIGNTLPNAPLQFSNAVANRKIVFYDISNNDNQYYGLGLNAGVLRYQVADVANNHVFYSDANATVSNELMRISGNGAVGIGVSDPITILDIKSRMRIRNSTETAGVYFDGTTNTYKGFIGMQTDNLIGLFGFNGAGWAVNMNATNGNLGVGTSNPTDKLTVLTGTSNYGISHTNGTSTISTYIDNTAGWIGTKSNHPLFFYTNGGAVQMALNQSGNLQLGGTGIPVGYKMSIDGKLICTELDVMLNTAWPDYVFKKDYKLNPLEKVENFINQNGHLPNLPKAEDIDNKVLSLGNMSKLQMEKIEELTLYIIDINKRLKQVEEENLKLKTELNQLNNKK